HGQIPSRRGRITRDGNQYRGGPRQDWGASRPDRGEIAAALTGLPAILGIYTRFPYRGRPSASGVRRDAWRIGDHGPGLPIHRDEARRLLDPAQPGADRRERRKIVVAAVGD